MSLSIDHKFLQPIEFKMSIKRLPHVSFFLQSAALPGLQSQAVESPTPFKTIYVSPDKLVYDPLVVEFIVDSNMNNHQEIMNWMIGLTFPDRFQQHANLVEGEGLYSDASLTMLTSQKNSSKTFQFKDIFPISISEIQLDTKQVDVQYAVCNVTFQHNGYYLA